MMKILIIILFMSTPCCKKNDNISINDGGIYIYEYSIKKPGQANVGFIITNDTSVVQKIDFKIYFSKGEVEKVLKDDNIKGNKYHYSQKENGNIFIEELNKICYSCENFISRNKLISDDIYEMISQNFLTMTNQERFKVLDSLVK
jgi:hypothetical protein